MHIFYELPKLMNTTLGLGFFDGVHKGHLSLITQVIKEAERTNSTPTILTFQNSPAEIFNKDIKYLTSTETKLKIFKQCGIENVIVLNFNKEFMALTANEYLKLLNEQLSPKTIITGFNHTFGKDKQGTTETLREYQSIYNYKYIEIPAVKNEDIIISSTKIKEFIKNGEIENGNKLLGRNFFIEGKVIDGNRVGRSINYPTANIVYPDNIIQIPFGVYSTNTIIDGEKYSSITNFGIKPTINKTNNILVETHIFNFDKNVYNKNARIEFKRKIRNELKFNSLQELQAQIQRDIKEC